MFHKQQQCPINFDRQLGISHFKSQRGIKLCITSLPTFLSRDEHFARFLITGRVLCQSVCLAPAWFRQASVCLPPHWVEPRLPQLRSLLPCNYAKSTVITRTALSYLHYQQCGFQARTSLFVTASTPQLGLFFIFFCPCNLAPTPWVDQITLLKERLSRSSAHPPLLAQPN